MGTTPNCLRFTRALLVAVSSAMIGLGAAPAGAEVTIVFDTSVNGKPHRAPSGHRSDFSTQHGRHRSYGYSKRRHSSRRYGSDFSTHPYRHDGYGYARRHRPRHYHGAIATRPRHGLRGQRHAPRRHIPTQRFYGGNRRR